MSKYSTNRTLFKDKACLVESLIEMGFDATEIEVHTSPKNLYGYYGDMREDTAEVIIRRHAVNRLLSGGASNDVGFKLQVDGTYGGIISQYDSSASFNTEKMGLLSAAYARRMVIKKAQSQGLRFAGTIKANGKTQLQFVKA